MITSEQMIECKTALLHRQYKLIERAQVSGRVVSAKESVGELSSYDNHPADMGTEQFERDKDIALAERAEKELKEINEALHSIEEGTYGICSTCGIDISFERLAAVPTTDRCVIHANDNQYNRERPVEEERLSPNINPDIPPDKEQVGYDAEDAWQEVSVVGTSETPSDFYGDRASYDDMYPNSDENVGKVEDVEDVLTANIDGNYEGKIPDYGEDLNE